MTNQSTQSIAERVAQVLELSPDTGAVEFEGRVTNWRALAEAAKAIEALLQAAGVPQDAPVGWVARNRSAGVAAFVALLAAGRPIAPLRPNQSLIGFRDEIRAQRLQAVIADDADWMLDGVIDAVIETGGAGVCVSGLTEFAVTPVAGLERVGAGPHRPDTPGMVVERLSSGTTGAPKRIPVDASVMLASLRSAEAAVSSKDADAPLRMKTSPGIILSPFTHAGGIFGLLMALYQARPIVLFDKFDVARWVEAVQRHKPKSASLVPAMMRMVLKSDTPKAALASFTAIRSGTAPLDVETQIEFETRFGIPVLIDYGAAEFIGGIAGWSITDHRRFAEQKRGSVGRPRPDVALRAVDPETGAALEPGQIGQLEIKSTRFAPDWIRTMDLASLDEDGFLYIHGRVDDAINRGGFKVLPDEVTAVLRQYPGVNDAAVMGVPDERLGQVPVAVIETGGGTPPDVEGLKAFARERLAPYQVPVEFRFVDALPRTTTMKVSRPELKALLGL
jgi:long-chain acyl-CoA synthetase